MEPGVLIALGALLISFVGLILNSRKDTRTDAATNAVTQTKLDNLITGVNEIRVEVRSMRESINDHSERLARVEAKAESNAHRLDSIEGKKGE
jgi:signal transduction histidine kinase